MRDKRILIVAATSSLMQAVCRGLAKKGAALILAGRDEEELALLADDLATRHAADARILQADFLHRDFSARRFIEKAGDFSDIVIALGDMGGNDKDDPDNINYTMYLNYTLPAQIASAAAASLDSRGRGCIVLISSVAGDRGRQSNYLYGAAKAALSTFASGLRNRYAKTGVHVLTIKPGFTDTPMTWGMQSPLIAAREKVAADIITAMEKRKDVLYTPWFWRFIMLIIIHIPERIFKKLKL